MASTLVAVASNLRAMASNLRAIYIYIYILYNRLEVLDHLLLVMPCRVRYSEPIREKAHRDFCIAEAFFSSKLRVLRETPGSARSENRDAKRSNGREAFLSNGPAHFLWFDRRCPI